MNTWAWQEPEEQARTHIKTTKVSAYIYEGLGLWQCVTRGLTLYILYVTFMAIVLMIDSVYTDTISLCLSVTLSILGNIAPPEDTSVYVEGAPQ